MFTKLYLPITFALNTLEVSNSNNNMKIDAKAVLTHENTKLYKQLCLGDRANYMLNKESTF